jgi:hypothetical protein
MKHITRSLLFAGLAVALFLQPATAPAQITTGTVTGRVVDASGGVIPGAHAVLISEARGTRSTEVVTNDSGDYVFPNVTADKYTVEVSAPSFKTLRVNGVVVTGGDRVGVPPMTLQVGGTTETVSVTAEAALVQTQSGERSFAIENAQIESLPVAHGNFTSMVAFVPGVDGGNNTSAGGTRLGGASQNNIMMDGISAMDTGNNGQMLNMNLESIGEVKVLTQGYSAEYGRSSGLQITAVTKSGTNAFHGSGYGIFTNSDWNSRTWVQQKNGDKPTHSDLSIYGYSVGGPVGKPGKQNKLFFFYAHEYRPQTITINNGNPVRLRVPTQLERGGDYSQSLDENGKPITSIFDYQSGQPFAGNKIPVSRLYAPGLAVLNRYPDPTMTQALGSNFNYEQQPGSYAQLTQQPALHLDYQLSSKLRFSGKYSGQWQRRVTSPGIIPGFSDAYVPYPNIDNYAITADYSINPTTFLEVTYGRIQNQLAGGNENGILNDPESNRLTSLKDFPMLYPDAGQIDPRSYGYKVMQAEKPPFWDGKSLNLPPTFGWGSHVGAAPPQQRYPGWLNINRTQDVSGSITKVAGRHTIKGGVYLNHSYKAQNVGAGGIANLSFQGYVNFGNDTNNTLDTGFGYANAATGIFTQYLQASKIIEGSLLYNQWEFYLQDNWKVTNHLTLDYGMRFVNQQPQYDQYKNMSNFFIDQWKAADAPVFYVAGCNNGATVCSSGNTRNAMDPRTGTILTAPGAANTQIAIGTPIPGTGNLLNGIRKAGDGIADTNYTWPTLVIGPRFGVAYDVTGRSNLVLRGGVGVFYDRPDGNTVFSTPGNPPIATAQDLRNGQLATLGQGLSPLPVPTLITFQYNAQVPTSVQWQGGFQKSLPWSMVADVMYVGNHGYNRLGGFQGGTRQLLNAVDIGAGYLQQNQDPTLGAETYPGQTAYTSNLLRPYKGFAGIEDNQTKFWDTYHSIQMSVNRRFQHGLSFGASYTYGISLKGNTGLNQRFVHGPDGSISLRSDEQAYEDLMSTLDRKPHFLKINAIWLSPGIGANRVLKELTRDWQIGSVVTAASGSTYDLDYNYNTAGANVNITGSPDWKGRVVVPNGFGGGCSDNQYSQFAASAVKGPGYHSVAMESPRNLLRGCANKNVDLSLTRRIRFGKIFNETRRLEFRADIYNALNAAIINGRSTTATFNNPTNMALQNNQYNTDGTLNATKLLPKSAGFGAANGAQSMRNLQLELRFTF